MRVVTFLRSICHVCPHGLVGSFTTTTDSQVEFHWVQCVRLKCYAEKLIGSSDSSCAAFQLYLIFVTQLLNIEIVVTSLSFNLLFRRRSIW